MKFAQERTLKNLFNTFINLYTLTYGRLIGPQTKKLVPCSLKISLSLKPLNRYLNILSLNNPIKVMQGKFMWKTINKERHGSQ